MTVKVTVFVAVSGRWSGPATSIVSVWRPGASCNGGIGAAYTGIASPPSTEMCRWSSPSTGLPSVAPCRATLIATGERIFAAAVGDSIWKEAALGLCAKSKSWAKAVPPNAVATSSTQLARRSAVWARLLVQFRRRMELVMAFYLSRLVVQRAGQTASGASCSVGAGVDACVPGVGSGAITPFDLPVRSAWTGPAHFDPIFTPRIDLRHRWSGILQVRFAALEHTWRGLSAAHMTAVCYGSRAPAGPC